MRRDLWIGLVLAVLTVGVYWPVRSHDFIFYDDPEFITENRQIQSGLNGPTIVYAITHPVVGNWHPVTTLSHALDCELFGQQAGSHHFVSVLLHAANALLLFLLLQQWRRMSSLRTGTGVGVNRPGNSRFWPAWLHLSWPSLLATLLFALHPLRVESVAWVAERKDVLSGFFFLLTLWFYTRFVQKQSPHKSVRASHQRFNFYLLSLAAFALGLMCKPMLVTVPFVLLLLDYWPFRRFNVSVQRFEISNLKSQIIEKSPFLLLSLIDCFITLGVQKSVGAMQVIERVTWSERLGNAVTSYVRYLGKLFWPMDLAIVYPHPAKHYNLTDGWPGWEIGLAALLLLLISALCLLQLRQRPYLAVGWFWFLGMLVPVIGFVQVGEQSMADRYTYLPLIGLVIALSWWLGERLDPERLAAHVPQSVQPPSPFLATDSAHNRLAGSFRGMAVVLIVASALILLTRHQLAYWQDTITLFEHAVAVTADNPSAQFAMGVALEKEGQPAKAMVRYRVATAIDRHYAKAYYNMGQVLRKSGQWQAAAEAYLASERSNPRNVATQLNLASVLPHLGRYREAIQHFEQALKMDSDSIEGLNNLAWLLATSPDPSVRDGARAVALAEHGCELTNFRMPVLLGTLAAAYAEAGRFTEAISAAERACAGATETGDSSTASLHREQKPRAAGALPREPSLP
jgi:Flp pilus assembly protein TadD